MRLTIDWQKRLPILRWLPEYSFSKLQSDVIAGVTVGLMVIPQGLAYASIAGLPPQYGLYTSLLGGFVYCFLGSSKDISQGPTAVMSLMVATYGSKHHPVDYATALSFFCGIIYLVMGVFSLGFIVRILPLPVISGFTSAAAIIVACGQMKHLLGLAQMPRALLDCLITMFSRLGKINFCDLGLGVICMILLVVLNSLKIYEWPSENYPPLGTLQRIARKLTWLVSTARNAVIVFASSLVAMAFLNQGLRPFTLTQDVEEGLPHLKFPSLISHDQNRTVPTAEVLSDLGVGLFVIPLIGFVENIAIAQAFARKRHYEVDATQELITLGVANIAGSFISAYPITGSFSRTTVNSLSGVATQLGGVFTGCIVILSLSVLTPFFKYIPKASLASIIILAVLRMVDFRIVKRIWQTNRIDLIPLFVTFLGCFYQLEAGLLFGVVVSLILFLYRRFVPKIEFDGKFMCNVKIHGGLTFMGVEYFISKIRDTALKVPEKPGLLVLDCSSMFECDFTVTEGLLLIFHDCKMHDIKLILYDVQEDIQEMLLKGGLPPDVFQTDLNGEFCGLLNA